MALSAQDPRASLTAANLCHFNPSLIQPMPPMSISSDSDSTSDNKAGDEDPTAKIVRLQSWIYNAMQTLVGLGAEGQAILAQDELVITGPGLIGLRSDPRRGSSVDINDAAYLQGKLAYLEAKCRPLSQERRRWRRTATREEKQAADAARALAEARAIESSNSSSEQHAGMRGGEGPIGSQHWTGMRISNALPTILMPTDEHGRLVDDGRSYYYETLRMLLQMVFDPVQAEAFLQTHAGWGGGGRGGGADPRTQIIDTAGMSIEPRIAFLLDQGSFLIGQIEQLCASMPHADFEALLLRHLPLGDFVLGGETVSETFGWWLSSMALPNAAATCWYVPYGLVHEHDRMSAELLDFVEANQGLVFSMWLHAAPGRVGEILEDNTKELHRRYILKLLAAALLSPDLALEVLLRNARSRRLTHFEMLKYTKSSVVRWLANVPPPAMRKRRPWAPRDPAEQPRVQTVQQPPASEAQAQATVQAPAQVPACVYPAQAFTHDFMGLFAQQSLEQFADVIEEHETRPALPLSGSSSGGSSSSSICEISPAEFARTLKRPFAPPPRDWNVAMRGGQMNYYDGDEDDDGNDPELPPAKRTRRGDDPRCAPSLQHDQSQSQSRQQASTADTPTSRPVVPFSSTGAPQSSVSSATDAAARVEMGKGKEKEVVQVQGQPQMQEQGQMQMQVDQANEQANKQPQVQPQVQPQEQPQECVAESSTTGARRLV